MQFFEYLLNNSTKKSLLEPDITGSIIFKRNYQYFVMTNFWKYAQLKSDIIALTPK